MKFADLEKLQAYKITKGSSDGTFVSGEIIWISENDDINSIPDKGCIEADEVPCCTLDFDAEEADNCIVEKSNGMEFIVMGC